MKINAVVNLFLSQRIVFPGGNMTVYGSGADILGGWIILPAVLAENSMEEKVLKLGSLRYCMVVAESITKRACQGASR